MSAMQQATLDLFDAPPPATQGDIDIARGGLSHFRNQMARYARQWPYLVPEWSAWIAYYERMAREGYAAAEAIRPAAEESEPSKMCGALTRRCADAPVCPWCDQQGWGICQHYDDTKTCVWRAL